MLKLQRNQNMYIGDGGRRRHHEPRRCRRTQKSSSGRQTRAELRSRRSGEPSPPSPSPPLPLRPARLSGTILPHLIKHTEFPMRPSSWVFRAAAARPHSIFAQNADLPLPLKPHVLARDRPPHPPRYAMNSIYNAADALVCARAGVARAPAPPG